MQSNVNRVQEIVQPLWQRLRPLLTVTYEYERLNERLRAGVVSPLSLIVGVASLLGLIGVLAASASTGAVGGALLRSGAGTFLLVLMPFGVHLLINSGRLQLASLLFVLAYEIIVAILLFPFGLVPGVLVMLIVPVMISAVLLRWRETLAIAVLAVALAAVITFPLFVDIRVDSYTQQSIQSAVTGLIIQISALAFIVVISYASTGRLDEAARGFERVTDQLEAAAVVTQTAAQSPTTAQLLEVVVERIRDAYGFYHAQVFLLDRERRMARLEASTGQAGEQLLARGHSLPVASRSVIGRCTAQGEPVVVNDTAKSETHRPNPLLPQTRAELALPLFVDDEVIGAIDVQSTEPDVFQPEDIQALELMAGQLATSIEKARLVDELQASAAENRSLLEEAQSSLRQIEELNRRLTRQGWTDYLQGYRAKGQVGYTITNGSVQSDTDWSAPMRQAYQGESSVVIRQGEEVHIAAVPIRVRGEVIGVLEIERSGNRPWSDEDLQMAERLVERLALAIENARLYEQATLTVGREQFVNRIGQEVQQAETIDDVLRTTLNELGDMLGASRGVVQIRPRDEEG